MLFPGRPVLSSGSTALVWRSQEQVSGPLREPHTSGQSQGYPGSPSAQPGRWDEAWDTVTRIGRAGPQGPGLLGVQGLQGCFTPWGGDTPGQVRDTSGTLAPLPAGALSQGRPGPPLPESYLQPPSHFPPSVWPPGAKEPGQCPWREVWHLLQGCGVQAGGRVSATGIGLGLGRVSCGCLSPRGRDRLHAPQAAL